MSMRHKFDKQLKNIVRYMIMVTVIEVKKKLREGPLNLIRRFSKSARGAGIIYKVRANRFFARKDSFLKTKNRALTKIIKGKEYERLKKLGKTFK
ncbi:hypothetical protein KJ973_02845 [Patescibacteria group bacterium]|nr:hypothetical protein [Patescibacteria group bacterium]MBU1246914.1 hypothetical protein [Patescibacteria group bacterium]MBU1519602.1 hypothetical protein [Patescibacteria group bacterium]MBU1730649.1 hypothetical protein [Patescibacteria group bacterium]MBU1956582.1 hypothetical protein [Patescibacteria group bacterium]